MVFPYKSAFNRHNNSSVGVLVMPQRLSAKWPCLKIDKTAKMMGLNFLQDTPKQVRSKPDPSVLIALGRPCDVGGLRLKREARGHELVSTPLKR